MGDRRFSLVLIVAVVVAIGAGFGVYSMLQRAQAGAQVPVGQVVVAAIDLTEGKILKAEDVRVATMPVSAVPPGSYSSPDSVVGRVTRIPVFSGEALVPGRLAPVGSGAGLEVKIAPGKRAMAVKIDEVAGLSGLIQPNSRVDVLVTVRDEEANNAQQRAKLFMSNMRVLSVGTQIERGPDGRPVNATTAALEVTPTEAEELAIASNQGRIQLVLRGFGDPDTVATEGASINDMMRRLDMTPAAPAAPARRATPPARPRVVSVPTPAPAAQTPPPAPKKPDSTVIQVYRGAKADPARVEKKDTIRP